MNTEWMGRYRPLVQALVQYANISIRLSGIKMEILPNVFSTPQEWQVLEYIVEHESDDANMIHVSEKLGIPKSSLSKYTKHLCAIGFVQRFQTTRNHKNIILKATEEGRAYYAERARRMMRPVFDPFFAQLDGIPDEALEAFVRALSSFNEARGHPPSKDALVPLQRETLLPPGE